MGFLSDILFGAKPDNNKPSVPKKVKEWEEDGWLDEDRKPVSSQSMDDTTVADSSDNEQSVDQPVTEEPDPYRDTSGRKILPEIEIERCKSNLSSNSDHLDVWVVLKNESEFDAEVTRINFLGRSAAGCFLRAGESREIRIYSGDTPKNDSYHTAQVQYKVLGNGDYFQADHHVEYKYEQDGDDSYYIPEEFHITRPVRDI